MSIVSYEYFTIGMPELIQQSHIIVIAQVKRTQDDPNDTTDEPLQLFFTRYTVLETIKGSVSSGEILKVANPNNSTSAIMAEGRERGYSMFVSSNRYALEGDEPKPTDPCFNVAPSILFLKRPRRGDDLCAHAMPVLSLPVEKRDDVQKYLGLLYPFYWLLGRIQRTWRIIRTGPKALDR